MKILRFKLPEEIANVILIMPFAELIFYILIPVYYARNSNTVFYYVRWNRIFSLKMNSAYKFYITIIIKTFYVHFMDHVLILDVFN